MFRLKSYCNKNYQALLRVARDKISGDEILLRNRIFDRRYTNTNKMIANTYSCNSFYNDHLFYIPMMVNDGQRAGVLLLSERPASRLDY